MRDSKKNWPELLSAVYKQDIESVKLLIDSGNDVNVQDSTGRTALMLSTNIELV